VALAGINVAFAGHNRALDLGDLREVEVGVRAAFSVVAATGLEDATLITGLADGADVIAARAWSALKLGPIHAVYPFLDIRPDRRVARLAASATWLDGAALEAGGRNPHLAQARWLISAADLLAVVWTGGRGRGAGGTADAVRLALEHHVPVLWVKPDEPDVIRLIRPEHVDDDFGFLEFLEQLTGAVSPMVTPATPAALAEAMASMSSEEDDADPPRRPTEALRRQGFADRVSQKTIWRTFGAFSRAVGGRVPAGPQPVGPPDDLLAQPGFQTLTDGYRNADAEAGRLSAVHRSQQILVLAAAIGAAIVGSSPALWPSLKIYAVLTELAVALAALTMAVGSARAGRHERWGRARRLAEQLRLERAAWTLGLNTTGDRLSGRGPGPSAARQIRRRAGLARGAYDPDRVTRWGGWAMEELVGGQARYHRVRGRINHRIAHRIHAFETVSFIAFVVALASFATAYLYSKAHGLVLPSRFTGVVVMTGAIVPALGAASLALEATLAFGEQGRRNEELAARLETIAATLGDAPGLDQLQQAAKAAIRLQISQEERWTDESFRRRLVRTG